MLIVWLPVNSSSRRKFPVCERRNEKWICPCTGRESLLYNGYLVVPRGRGGRGVGLTPHPYLVPKVIEKSRAIPLLTLRACVAYKKGGNLPTRREGILGGRGVGPVSLGLGSTWRCVVTFTPQPLYLRREFYYPLNDSVGGLQSRCTLGTREEFSNSAGNRNVVHL